METKRIIESIAKPYFKRATDIALNCDESNQKEAFAQAVEECRNGLTIYNMLNLE